MEVNDSAHKNTTHTFSHYFPLGVVAVFVILFFPTFESLYVRWIKWDEGLSHGLLVAGVFLFLLFKSLPWNSKPQPTFLYLASCLALAACSLAWALFSILNITLLEQLVLLPLLALAFAASLGFATAVKHRILLLMPIFAIPIWDQLNELLVNISATVVGEMVRLIKMSAIIDGNSIYIPYGHILIADGCSGIRYFVIALAIGYIIGYLNRYDEKRMLMILAVAGMIGLLANWIRIFILILVGYQSRMESSLMADHEMFGWILFGLLCLPAIYFAPVVKAAAQPIEPSPTAKPKLILPLSLLALGPVIALVANPQPKVEPWQDLLPTTWQPSTANRMPIKVLSPTGGHRENAHTRIGSTRVFIQLDHYQRHTKEEKLVPYITRLYDNFEWSITDTFAMDDGPALITILRQKSGQRQVAQAQWFVTGSHETANIRNAKLLQIPALLQNDNRFMIVTLQSECESLSCDNAISALQNKAQNLFDKE